MQIRKALEHRPLMQSVQQGLQHVGSIKRAASSAARNCASQAL